MAFLVAVGPLEAAVIVVAAVGVRIALVAFFRAGGHVAIPARVVGAFFEAVVLVLGLAEAFVATVAAVRVVVALVAPLGARTWHIDEPEAVAQFVVIEEDPAVVSKVLRVPHRGVVVRGDGHEALDAVPTPALALALALVVLLVLLLFRRGDGDAPGDDADLDEPHDGESRSRRHLFAGGDAAERVPCGGHAWRRSPAEAEEREER